MTGRLLGRLGWRGQCSCCNDQRPKRAIKRAERRQWLLDADR